MAEFTNAQWQKINTLLLRVNAASDATALRFAVLEDVPGIIPHQCSFFDLCSRYRSQRLYFDPLSLNMDEKQLDDYYTHYADIDYTSWLLNQTEQSIVYRDSDYFTDKLLQHSQLYLNWLRPMGAYYGAGVNLIENDIPYGSLTLYRSVEAGDFADSEMELLETLLPHLGQRFTQLYPNGVVYNANQPQFRELQTQFLLTAREDEIVRLLYSGTDTKIMAEMLFISESTVRKHIANIYHKLHVQSRPQLMKLVSRFIDETKALPSTNCGAKGVC